MDIVNSNFKERTVFMLIDSKDRDMRAFPTASEFDVVLDVPVSKVCGVEVVDVQLAKTETNIDNHNNRMVIRLLGDPEWVSLRVPIGDYNSSTISKVLASTLQLLPNIDFASVSYVDGKLIISTGHAIEINLSASSIRWVMGFGDLEIRNSHGLEIVSSIVASETITLLKRTGFSLLPMQTDWGLVLPALDFDCNVYGEIDVLYSSPFIVAWRITSRMDTNIVYMDNESRNAALFPGQYSLLFVLDPIRASIGEKVNISLVQIDLKMIGYTLQSKGLMDLAGTRYVTIRCPELEPYLYRGLPQSARRMGLAKVSFTQSGYNSIALSTANFKGNRFFPISNITRFSLRIERDDGNTYDLKGVNYTATIAMHIMEPASLSTNTYSGISTIPRNRAFTPVDFQRFEIQSPR
jgi:hypothetical protein